MAFLGKDKGAGASQANNCDFGEFVRAMIFIHSLVGPETSTCQHTVLVLCQTYTRSLSDSYPRVKPNLLIPYLIYLISSVWSFIMTLHV